jgi:hypothetical protein
VKKKIEFNHCLPKQGDSLFVHLKEAKGTEPVRKEGKERKRPYCFFVACAALVVAFPTILRPIFEKSNTINGR